MSFGQLRSARKAKESHSFVKKLDNDTGSFESVSSNENTEETALAGSHVPAHDPDLHPQGDLRPSLPPEKEKTKLVDLQGCHTHLPATPEIRESLRHGRGIYTKSTISAGMLSSLDSP